MKTKLVLFIKKNINILLLTSSYISIWFLFFLEKPINKLANTLLNRPITTNELFYGIVIILLIITILYLYFYQKISKISLKKLLIFSIFLNLFLSLFWPIGTSDIFGYIYYGRIFSIFHESPYITVYNNFNFDQFFYFLKNIWIFHPAPYGPIFIFISSFFSLIFKNDPVLNIFFLKIFFSVINILNGYLIYKITKRKTCFYLYAFNPLVLFELAVEAHNDSLLIMFILFSFLFFKKAIESLSQKEKIIKYFLSFIFFVFSILTKFTSLIFAPSLLIISMTDLKKISNKAKLLIIYFLTFFCLAFIFYKPLTNGIADIFLPIIKQSKLEGFYSPFIYIVMLCILPFAKNPIATSIFINKIIFFVLSAIILLKLYFKKRPFKDTNLFNNYVLSSSIILTIFYATFFSWILPWYFILLIVLFLLNYKEENRQSKIALYSIIFLTVYGISYYLTLR